MSREGLGVPRPNRSISGHITGLWNNGCLLKTINYGGERGGWLVPRYQASHQKKTVTK